MDYIAAVLLWPTLVSLPLILTTNDLYKDVFPSSWYDVSPTDYWNGNIGYPSPLGLTLGLITVVIGQISVLVYFCQWKIGKLGTLPLRPVQRCGAPSYKLIEAMKEHLSQPEGFVLLGGYLVASWMLGLMPSTYYSMTGGINWLHVAMQLLCVDAIQCLVHNCEHNVSKRLYRMSHKPHHRFTNPKLFDAFNGSIADTVLMILLPLMLTARVVPANVWSYMAFGSLYANWLCLIHSEYVLPWDDLFRRIGFGTAADHHVHHKLFVYNYGHLFM